MMDSADDGPIYNATSELSATYGRMLEDALQRIQRGSPADSKRLEAAEAAGWTLCRRYADIAMPCLEWRREGAEPDEGELIVISMSNPPEQVGGWRLKSVTNSLRSSQNLEVVGYTICGELDVRTHLQQIAVWYTPDAGGGIAAALVDAIRWAISKMVDGEPGEICDRKPPETSSTRRKLPETTDAQGSLFSDG